MLEPQTEPAKNYGSYGSYHVKEYGNRPRKAAQNYASYMGSLSRRDAELNGDDESSLLSPPLWKMSPTASPQHRRNNYRSLSPASKAQAIARGQRELMEMVSKMPESCYELTLKDLVEQQPVDEFSNRQESFREENRDPREIVRKSDQNYKKVQMKRNGSLNNKNNNSNEGFLLKMVFPVAFGSKKTKKKKELVRNNSSKISPKSPVNDGSDKSVDKEWWKKSFSVSSENSGSTGSSSNGGSGKSSSSSISSSSSRHEKDGCWPFVRTKKCIKAA
ncbi:uncharacterized protein LOC116117202 [Pistacia vera]|uniref:uncharacterized protein LOC116117202 n=1 Tax=Pistacia vera TaxID=55513 RepID=UPI00126377F1|nr:uncharacterized protein LOC116117202 [Pistacia vera]